MNKCSIVHSSNRSRNRAEPASHRRRSGPRAALIAVALAVLLPPGATRAGPRYFTLSYTPDLGRAGESEAALWGTSKSGKQDASEPATLEGRAEWEHAITDRVTGAAYLNVVRPPGGMLRLDSASLELIARPAALARFAGGPALYLEITESGDELELEPKLLFGVQRGAWVAASNLIADFGFRHNGEERLDNGDVLRNELAAELTAGLARRLGAGGAFGLEARARSEHPNFGPQAAAVAFAGPVASLAIGEARLTIAALPQLWGDPPTSGSRNLVDFSASEVRAVLSLEF
jgi:hypothetical protein